MKQSKSKEEINDDRLQNEVTGENSLQLQQPGVYSSGIQTSGGKVKLSEGSLDEIYEKQPFYKDEGQIQ